MSNHHQFDCIPFGGFYLFFINPPFVIPIQTAEVHLGSWLLHHPSSLLLSIFFFFSFSKACVQKPTLLLLWYAETVGSDAIFWVHGSMPTYFSLPLCLCGLVVQEKIESNSLVSYIILQYGVVFLIDPSFMHSIYWSNKEVILF